MISLWKLREVRIFTGGRSFCHEVFYRMYVPLALEVYNRPFIDNLGFMAVDKIKKHLLGPSFLPSPCRFGQNEGLGEYI